MQDKNEKEISTVGENVTIEETFEALDDIMVKLADDTLPLEKSIQLYKEGMDKLNECRRKIEAVEGKLEQLGEDYAS